MSRNPKKLFWPSFLAFALGLTALAFASVRKAGSKPAGGNQPTALSTSTTEPTYVLRARLWPQLRSALNELGDRLERPGNERLTLASTIKRPGDAVPLPAQLIIEFPDRLRLTVQDGISTRVLTFDGTQARATGGEPNAREKDLIESLIDDSAEHFFIRQTRGVATRSLGNRFRADDGTCHDIYQVSEQFVGTSARTESKFYCFNSDTLLLEKVFYNFTRNGTQTRVETRIGNWQQVLGQRVPGRITRLENNEPIMTMVIGSALLSPRVNDGIFTTP